jgi:hypothetical protein
VFCDRQKGPLIAVLGIVIRTHRALLFLHERPRFVDLNEVGANVSQFAIKNALSFLARDAQHFENCFRVYLIQSRGCTDSASFCKTRKNTIDSFFRQIKRLTNFFGLRERLAAARALKARSLLCSVVSVYVRLAIASSRASLHGVPSSFLTAITVTTTMRLRALSGIYGVSQVKNLRECYQHALRFA